MKHRSILWWVALACVILVYSGLVLLGDRVVLDCTSENLTTLSEGTTQTLEGLSEEVQILLIYREETQNDLRARIETVASSYARNPWVTVDAVDPVSEPGRLSAYQTSGQTLAEGSAIVANADGSRFKVIPAAEMVDYAVSASGVYSVTGLLAEQKLTAGIRGVTGAEATNVYFLTGHREADSSRCTELVSRLDAENYSARDFSLQEGTLARGDVLLILSPSVDLTEGEYAALTAFLDDGGRMLLACDATINLTSLPYFESLAARYSLAFEPGLVVESEAMASYWVSSPLYLMPKVNGDSEYTSAFSSDKRVILPGARAVTGPEIPLSGHTYEALLTTSEQSYIKRTDSKAFTQEPGDPVGAWPLAVSVKSLNETSGAESRVVFTGSLYCAMDNSLLRSSSNMDWMMAVIGRLAEREDAVNVPVRALGDTSMSIPSAAEAWILFGTTLALPLLFSAAGAVILARRRRK